LKTEPPVLAYPDFSKPFLPYSDVSDVKRGAILLQKQEEKFRIIRYLSRTLTSAERHYSSSERKCLAIVHSVNLLKPYLLDTNFTVMTDCKALLTLKENANFKSRLMRWHLALQQCTFGIKHLKGEENLGDILSRIDLSDLESKSLKYIPWIIQIIPVALTGEQETEAKELCRVLLFRVLQDQDALKTISFDKITNKKVRSCLKHIRLGEDGSTIFVTHLGKSIIFQSLRIVRALSKILILIDTFQ
jgi:hypothetical protein